MEVESLGNSTRELRKQLVAVGVLKKVEGNSQLYRFAQQYAFDSASAAAGVVSGTGLNGRKEWKLKGKDTTLKEWEEQQVASSKPEGASA